MPIARLPGSRINWRISLRVNEATRDQNPVHCPNASDREFSLSASRPRSELSLLSVMVRLWWEW